MTYHKGELAMQTRAGVQHMAQRIGRGIHPAMPSVAQDFLLDQSLAVVASVAAHGQVWASLLMGEPGFLNPIDDQTVHIAVQSIMDDRLLANLSANPHIGMVAVEFATRRRIRLNGTAHLADNHIHLKIQQAYANCPKYIQVRLPQSPVVRQPITSQPVSALSAQHQQWLAQADTFFIASYFAGGGADASHRGGQPGFVRVIDSNRLEFPDYAGNTMFNTLGNIEANPRAGLLFLDFARGSTLQLTGQAHIIWDVDRVAAYPGAERVVEFQIEQGIETTNVMPFRFEFLQYSPVNPPVLIDP